MCIYIHISFYINEGKYHQERGKRKYKSLLDFYHGGKFLSYSCHLNLVNLLIARTILKRLRINKKCKLTYFLILNLVFI